jgi:hypothetical protein
MSALTDLELFNGTASFPWLFSYSHVWTYLHRVCQSEYSCNPQSSTVRTGSDAWLATVVLCVMLAMDALSQQRMGCMSPIWEKSGNAYTLM